MATTYTDALQSWLNENLDVQEETTSENIWNQDVWTHVWTQPEYSTNTEE